MNEENFKKERVVLKKILTRFLHHVTELHKEEFTSEDLLYAQQKALEDVLCDEKQEVLAKALFESFYAALKVNNDFKSAFLLTYELIRE
jgi:hypothetical protein